MPIVIRSKKQDVRFEARFARMGGVNVSARLLYVLSSECFKPPGALICTAHVLPYHPLEMASFLQLRDFNLLL